MKHIKKIIIGDLLKVLKTEGIVRIVEIKGLGKVTFRTEKVDVMRLGMPKSVLAVYIETETCDACGSSGKLMIDSGLICQDCNK